MTIDHSVTAAEVLFITKLVDRVGRDADPRDARELARRMAEAIKRPDRRVADAFGIKPPRDRRDHIVRNLLVRGRSENRHQPSFKRPAAIAHTPLIGSPPASAAFYEAASSNRFS